MRAYGITPEDYDRMDAEQDGKCAACARPPLKYRLAVDHNHDTGKVRGLLCVPCNRALWRARGLVAYIERTDG